MLMVAGAFLPRAAQAADASPSASGRVISSAPPDTAPIERKLDAIRIPAMEFQGVPLREAVGQLHQAAAKGDVATVDPGKRGVNMVIKLEEEKQPGPVTVVLNEGSLRQALTAVAAAAKTKIVVHPYAVSFVAENEFTDHLVTKEYSAPDSLSAHFRKTNGKDGRVAPAYGVREWFETKGVSFPPGAFATLAQEEKLVVRNSEANLRIVERVLDGLESETTR